MAAPLLQETAIKQNAIEILAGNPSQVEAAKKLGVHESTISRFKDKHQDLIQKQAEKYLAVLPSVVDQDINEMKEAAALSIKLVQYLKDGSKACKTEEGVLELFPEKEVRAIQKFIEYTDKKVTDIKRSIGLYSSHTPAMIFQTMNIYNDNRSVISGTVLQALNNTAAPATDLPEGITIDVDK